MVALQTLILGVVADSNGEGEGHACSPSSGVRLYERGRHRPFHHRLRGRFALGLRGQTPGNGQKV